MKRRKKKEEKNSTRLPERRVSSNSDRGGKDGVPGNKNKKLKKENDDCKMKT